jgi:hypothetical protein
MLAGDAELAVRDVVTLWPGILVKETRRETEREALLRAALEPTWKGAAVGFSLRSSDAN